MSTAHVEISNMSTGYNGTAVLQEVCWSVEKTNRWAIIGRNGTGKSTLVKALAGLLRPLCGKVVVHGKQLSSYPDRQRARHIAYVPQKMEGTIPYTVYDFVMLGRYARMGLFATPERQDHLAVQEALDLCDVGDLRTRMMNTLSGGEAQRVLLAGALAQKTDLLLLDEPTTSLDPAHERLFLNALEVAQQNRGITTIMVTHDINTALGACSHILTLLNGRVFSAGPVSEFRAQCPEILQTIFGITFHRFSSSGMKNEVYGTWEM